MIVTERPDARRVPHDERAEEDLVGAVLLRGELLDEIATTGFTPADLWDPTLAQIMDAAWASHMAGDPVEPSLLAHRLDGIERVEARMVELMASAPATSTAAILARRVHGHARQRRLLAAVEHLAAEARTDTDDVDALLDRCAQTFFDACQHPTAGGPVALAEGLEAHMDLVDARHEGRAPTGTPTGLDGLDDITGGLGAGQLIVVAGRPGMGKSALMCVLATGAARRGHPVLFVSLEMSSAELYDRFLATEAQVNLDWLRKGTLGSKDRERMERRTTALYAMPIEVLDDPSAGPMSIRAAARQIARRHGGLGAIVVDYLQLMVDGRRHENRQVEVASLSRQLKLLARGLDVPVVVGSQLNRKLEDRREKRPVLADLRESGAIENDADVVLGLFREAYYAEEATPSPAGVLEAIVLKQRNGPTGTVELFYDAATGRITSPRKEPF